MDTAVSLDSDHLQVLAEIGFSGHMGGLEATTALATACHVDRGDRVLDVGAGTGRTPAYLANERDTRLVAVDISPKMVATARETSSDDVAGTSPQFAVGDGTRLPFEAGSFDAVLCESVLAFVDDPSTALAEFRRVAKPGGYVGVNEVTWLDADAADDWYRADSESLAEMVDADFETPAGWRDRFAAAGFDEIYADIRECDLASLLVEELRRHGGAEVASAGVQFAEQLLTDPEFREFVGTVLSSRGDVRTVFEDLGYGLYVARAT